MFPQEPFPKNHKLRKLKNVIFSPHRAGALDQVFKEMGDFQKAKISYKKAFQFQPTNLETLDTLSSLDTQILDEKLLTQIKTTLTNKNLMKKDVAYGNFLLAKYELSKNNFEGEFEHLLKGHLHDKNK